MMRERYKSGQFALTKAQVDKLMESITDIRDKAMIEIAVSGGLRRDDVVNIQKKNLDFSDNSLTFNEKKKKRIKKIYLPSKVMQTCQMVLNAFPKDKDGRLFPISSKTAYNRFQMYLDRAGISRRPFHSLRATCIKLCQASSWSPEQTADLVGDKISTIQEHYLTPSVEEMRAVAEARPVI